MVKRDFDAWLSKFRASISGYRYYIDFDKVVRNVEDIKIELNILNSLIGSVNIEDDFEKIITKYPETLSCIPLLLAVRSNEIYAQDENGAFKYNFKTMNYDMDQYKIFMRKTGLFDLLQKHLVNNLVDYALGIETGLDSNGRKNRGGSKLNETARSYKMLSQEADTIEGFSFVWFTDGIGWKSARGNLRETFEVMEHVYNIDDMEHSVMTALLV